MRYQSATGTTCPSTRPENLRSGTALAAIVANAAESTEQSVREWAIAVGTVGATVVALYIGVRRERLRRPKLLLEYGGAEAGDAVVVSEPRRGKDRGVARWVLARAGALAGHDRIDDRPDPERDHDHDYDNHEGHCGESTKARFRRPCSGTAPDAFRCRPLNYRGRVGGTRSTLQREGTRSSFSVRSSPNGSRSSGTMCRSYAPAEIPPGCVSDGRHEPATSVDGAGE